MLLDLYDNQYGDHLGFDTDILILEKVSVQVARLKSNYRLIQCY